VPKQLCDVEVVAQRRQREVEQPLDGGCEDGRDLVVDEEELLGVCALGLGDVFKLIQYPRAPGRLGRGVKTYCDRPL
jgi:hypothetical protein